MKKGIQALAFSPSGKILAGVAIDDNHYVAAYDVESGACLGCEKGDTANILEIAFKSDTEFATAGPKHFKVWTIGSGLKGKKGGFGKRDQRIGSCKFTGTQYLTGSITGEMYVWDGGSVTKAIKLHERPMDAISVTREYVFTGGRDGVINVLSNPQLQKIFSFSIDEKYASVNPVVRALCLSETKKNLLIGTQGSEIYEIPIDIN